MVPGLFLCHDLNIHRPAGIISLFYGHEQISAVAFSVFGNQCLRLRIGQILNSLLCLEMELTPYPFIFLVIESKGMLSEKVHIAECCRNSPVGHNNSGLMERFRQKSPEIPVILCGTHSCPGIAFYGPVQIREIMYIPQEKCRGIISHQVPIAFFGIKFNRNSSDITLGIGPVHPPRWKTG